MFKKIFFCAVCVAAIALTAACSSVQVATDLGTSISANPAAASKGHINVDIWGIYIFGMPVFTGSHRQDGGCRMFDDTVHVSNAVQMLTSYAQVRLDASAVTDIKTERTTYWLWPTIFFYYKDVQASGNAIK